MNVALKIANLDGCTLTYEWSYGAGPSASVYRSPIICQHPPEFIWHFSPHILQIGFNRDYLRVLILLNIDSHGYWLNSESFDSGVEGYKFQSAAELTARIVELNPEASKRPQCVRERRASIANSSRWYEAVRNIRSWSSRQPHVYIQACFLRRAEGLDVKSICHQTAAVWGFLGYQDFPINFGGTNSELLVKYYPCYPAPSTFWEKVNREKNYGAF